MWERIRTETRTLVDRVAAEDMIAREYRRVFDLHLATGEHSQRLAYAVAELAYQYNEPEDAQVSLTRAALLHDTRKTDVDLLPLLDKGALSKEEWTLLMEHPRRAHDCVQEWLHPIDPTALHLILTHHEVEKPGRGPAYPRAHNRGEPNPLLPYFTVCDTLDAVIFPRFYNRHIPLAEKLRKVQEEMKMYHGLVQSALPLFFGLYDLQQSA